MSKGMQQRLGIAQAMIGEPRLLLLDEPTSALDPAGRRTVRELLERLRERGVSVLLNSHLLSEVELVCDRVAIIDRGEVVAAGSPRELSHAGGVEVDTGSGVRRFAQAAREDVPRLVRELVAAGRGRLRRARAALVARGHLPRAGRRAMSAVAIVAGFALRESRAPARVRVVALLTVAFLALYALGTWQAFKTVDEIRPQNGIERRVLAGATLLGLSMFATVFLGAILAVFLTLGAVRGDAERGLLQPLLVRPLPRATFLLGRFAAAASVCAAYVIAVFLAAVAITRPSRRLVAGPAARAGARARRRRDGDRGARARRLGRALEHGQRDRGLHALRRRADRGPAGVAERWCGRTLSQSAGRCP